MRRNPRTVDHLHFPGSPNFRDAGGDAAPRSRVRGGHLLRSGHLAGLSQVERDRLAAMGIGLVCDLRLADERDAHPNRVDPETEARTHHFDIMPGSADGFRDEIMRGVLAPESARRFMLEIYRELARDYTEHYARALRLAVDAPAGPVLIHCAAGKDRTGWGVALFQLALGVPQDEIRAGYLLSAERFPIALEIEASQRDWHEKGAPPVSAEALAPLYGIDVAYLDAALEEAEKVAGSLEAYLREVLRLTPELREALEERFLERD